MITLRQAILAWVYVTGAYMKAHTHLIPVPAWVGLRNLRMLGACVKFFKKSERNHITGAREAKSLIEVPLLMVLAF